jgi:hypothetical protein
MLGMSQTSDNVLSDLASFHRLLLAAAGSLQMRDIALMQAWLAEHSKTREDIVRTALLNVLLEVLPLPHIPKQNMIYMLHEIMIHIKTIDAEVWKEVIHKVLDLCAPLVEYRHREKIITKVLKLWIGRKFVTEAEAAKWVAVLSVVRSYDTDSISAEERDRLLRYTEEILSLLFESSRPPPHTPGPESPSNGGAMGGERSHGGSSGHSHGSGPASAGKYPPGSGGRQHSAGGEGNHPRSLSAAVPAPGSGGQGSTSAAYSVGQRSTGGVGLGGGTGGSSGYNNGGGQFSGASRSGSGDEHGQSWSLTVQRARLSTAMAASWVLHHFLSTPLTFRVEDLKCLAFGAVLLAGKV